MVIFLMNLNILKEKNKKLAVFEKLDFRNDIDDWVALLLHVME